MKDHYTHIAIVLDRSGSMESTRDDAIGGYNGFLEQQKSAPGHATLSLIGFDHVYEVWQDFAPLPSVPPLSRDSFVPRGSTALYDAIARTVDDTGARLAAMAEDQRPSKVIVLIITDGGENASHQFSSADVQARIRRQRDRYQWLFVFMGSNQDAILTASGIGIGQAQALSVGASGVAVRRSYASMSKLVTDSRQHILACAAFSAADRQAQFETMDEAERQRAATAVPPA